MVSSLMTNTFDAGCDPKSTVVPPLPMSLKRCPVKVTVVPPLAGPAAGASELSSGCLLYAKPFSISVSPLRLDTLTFTD